MDLIEEPAKMTPRLEPGPREPAARSRISTLSGVQRPASRDEENRG